MYIKINNFILKAHYYEERRISMAENLTFNLQNYQPTRSFKEMTHQEQFIPDKRFPKVQIQINSCRLMFIKTINSFENSINVCRTFPKRYALRDYGSVRELYTVTKLCKIQFTVNVRGRRACRFFVYILRAYSSTLSFNL